MSIAYPRVYKDSNNKFFVSFYLNNKRHRLYNGKRIGSGLKPNTFPISKRNYIANLLAAEVYKHFSSGGEFLSFKSSSINLSNRDSDIISSVLIKKQKESTSIAYKKLLMMVGNKLISQIGNNKISRIHIERVLDGYKTNTSYNTVRKHINVIVNEAKKNGLKTDEDFKFRSKKTYAKLNKPFKNVSLILDDIKKYNKNLYLCCLLTYGCLLRPHREIRELFWRDFSDDLSYINLSGKRNKSGNNRIVPVPKFIRENLNLGDPDKNVFSCSSLPFNSDYFKSLWNKYRHKSKFLEDNQTLYSFRHSGAINIFKRTGSVTKIQKAMGHSSIKVSLTYLRGLEIPELKEEDMPTI